MAATGPRHDAEQVAERLRKLQSIADAALSHLALDDLLHELLERMREVFACDTAAVLMLDEDANELVARAARGLEEEVERGVRIPVGRGFAGSLVGQRRAIAIPDVEHADVVNPILREKGVKSLLGAPLIARGRVLGVVHVGTLTPRVFTADDVELMELAAERAALAVEHGRLYEAEHAAAERLRKLQKIADAALAPLSLDELLSELLERMREVFACDTAAVLLLDEDTNELVARAARGLEEEVERGVRIPVGRGFAGRIAAERMPITIADLDRADVFNPILREKGIKSMLGAPLIVRERVLGVIHVGTLTPRVFTAADVELIELAAERVAASLEKALIQHDLIRLDQLRHQFVAIASHEVRTPTAAVLGAAATLEHRAGQLQPEIEAELRTILREQAQRLADLVDHLLDLSRVESRAIELRPTRIHVRERLLSLVSSVAPDRADVEVVAPNDHEVEVDGMTFDRIVSNLVINALRHGAPPVVISSSLGDQHFRVTVEDRGRGVAPEFRGRLFDQFARADDAGVGGSGLGLAIARSYARAHGGDIIYSDAEPNGARFEVVLPRRLAVA